MADGTQIIPQSALAIGQTPLSTIQGPAVPVSVPNPIDVSNFFRMQQGQQSNVGILQNAEQIKMRQQEMDLRNYENSVRQMDKIMGLANNAFSDFYGQQKSRSKASAGSISPVFSDLDPTRNRHKDVATRMNAFVDKAQNNLDTLGQEFMSMNNPDPAVREEVVRNMNNIINRTKRDMSQDAEFFELTTMHRAYNEWLDRLAAAEKKGANINLAAVDKMQRDYDRWTDDGVGDLNLNSFRLDRFVYDGGSALKRMAADAEDLGKAAKEFEAIPVGQDGVVEGKRATRRSLDDITDAMTQKYANDKDAVSLYENAVKGQLKQDGTPYSFRDWMKAMSAPFAPQSGKESVIENVEGFLVKPGKDETDPSTGGGRPKSSTSSKGKSSKTSSTSSKAGYDNRGLINVLGRKPYASEMDIVELGNTVQERGFDITKGDFDMTPYDWGKVAELEDKNRLEIQEFKNDGTPANRGEGDYIQFIDKGFTNDLDEVVVPRSTIVEFPKAGKTKEGVAATPAPKGNVYQHQIRETNLPFRNGVGDLGSKNNNPGNLKATPAQISAGVPVDSSGFIIFPSLKEGLDANFKDINYKMDGKSHRFEENSFLIDKYGKENLSPGKYLEVATVEDLLHVRTPREDYGGDNTMEEFENFLKHLEKRGFPRDMKIADLQDRFNFNASIFEVESPDSYNRAFGKGGFMPATHADEVDVSPGANDNLEAKLTDDGLARNTMDRIIMGDDELSEDELMHFFDHPPAEFKNQIADLKSQWDLDDKLLGEYKGLVEKKRLYTQLGKEFSAKDEEQLNYLEARTNDPSMSGFERLRFLTEDMIAKEMEPLLTKTFVDDFIAQDKLAPGDIDTFDFDDDSIQDGEDEGFIVSHSPIYKGVYTVVPKLSGGGIGEGVVMSKNDLGEFLKSKISKMNLSSRSKIFTDQDVSKAIQETARGSLEARSSHLQKRQLELDSIARGRQEVRQMVDYPRPLPGHSTEKINKTSALDFLRQKGN